MKQNWAICLLLLIGTVAGKESHAGDDIPIVQESHQHTFKSKPIEMANRKGIQYDVCNSSSAASGIKWIQAGFGIGAPDELQPAHCARFTTFSGEYHKQSVSEVVFQDEVRAHVENWRYCDVLLDFADSCGDNPIDDVYRFITSFSLFRPGPDENNIPTSLVEIGFFANPGKQYGAYATFIPEGRGSLIMVFATGDRNAIGNASVFTDEFKKQIPLRSLKAIKDAVPIEISYLDRDLPDDAPAILLTTRALPEPVQPAPEDRFGPITAMDRPQYAFLETGQLNLLGTTASILLVREGRVAIRAEIRIQNTSR